MTRNATHRPLTSDETKVIDITINGKGGFIVVAVGDNSLGLRCFIGEGPRGGQFVLNEVRYRNNGRMAWQKSAISYRGDTPVEVEVGGL